MSHPTHPTLEHPMDLASALRALEARLERPRLGPCPECRRWSELLGHLCVDCAAERHNHCEVH